MHACAAKSQECKVVCLSYLLRISILYIILSNIDLFIIKQDMVVAAGVTFAKIVLFVASPLVSDV